MRIVVSPEDDFTLWFYEGDEAGNKIQLTSQEFGALQAYFTGEGRERTLVEKLQAGEIIDTDPPEAYGPKEMTEAALRIRALIGWLYTSSPGSDNQPWFYEAVIALEHLAQHYGMAGARQELGYDGLGKSYADSVRYAAERREALRQKD